MINSTCSLRKKSNCPNSKTNIVHANACYQNCQLNDQSIDFFSKNAIS